MHCEACFELGSFDFTAIGYIGDIGERPSVGYFSSMADLSRL